MNWHYYKGALVSKLEAHHDVKISKEVSVSLLKSNNAFFIRYTTDFDQNCFSPAYYVIKDSWKGIDELSTKTRNQVRKALKMCDVKRIDKEVLFSQGYEVFKEHTVNFKNNDNNILNYEEYVAMIQNLSNRDLFGCFDLQTDKLIAYAQNIVGEGVNYSLLKAIPKFYKSHYPFYALIFKMNEFYLFECKKKYVCDGFRSLDNHSNIQNFLIEKFKFRKAYCKLHIQYVWWLKLIIAFLYPLRKFVKAGKIKSLLFQEEISRNSINC
jgi:hypothetical protein